MADLISNSIGNDATANPRAHLPLLPAQKLTHLIGHAPHEWTVSSLVDVVRETRVRLVSFLHVGGDGWLKALDFVPRDLSHLHDVLSGGERADGSSLFGTLGIAVGASDIVIRPRPSTAFLDPFSPEPTLAILCSHYGRDGRPLPVSPDTLVREAHERLKRETGIDLHALGEVEYFLGKPRTDSDVYGGSDRGYHAAAPFVFGEALRRRALLLLAEIGVPIKSGHSEVGYIQAVEDGGLTWEQHEIELNLQSLPAAADSVVLTQWVLRNLAAREGLRCSFEPVVLQGHAGTGLHFHLSPVIGGKPRNHTGETGELVEQAKWLIGGLVLFSGALMAFGNRARTSFLRLTQAKEAPDNVTWGRYDRKALVRLPIVPADEDGHPTCPETIEFRLPDGSAHPHLLLAAVAQVMAAGRNIQGLDELLEMTAASAPRRPDGKIPVPRTFAEAAEALRQNRGILEAADVFPKNLVDRVIDGLKQQA
jgi:glutamine synthetase